MTSDIFFQVLLRLLPSIVILALAFIAGSDRKSREQWANLLYQAGSLRPEQRDDPKVQNGVRLPFFVVAVLFLIWPIAYYRHATQKFEVSATAYGVPQPGANYNPYGGGPNAATKGTPEGTPGGTPNGTPNGTPLPATPSGPNYSPYGTAATPHS